MKKIMNVPKLVLNVGLLFMLVLVPYLGKATPNGIGWISNCYQKIYFGANGVHDTKNLLHFGGNPVFSFGSTSGTDLRYFTVRPYDPVTGITGGYIPFPLNAYTWIINGAGDSVKIYENNQPTVSLPSGASFLLDFYGPAAMYSLSLTVNFIGVNEAFKIQPIFQSCFTYGNFQFDADIVQLEGFCGELDSFKLKLPPGAPNTMGLPSNFSKNIYVSNTSGTIASEADSVDIDWSQCSNPNYACPMSTSCGCITFNLEFKLRPCLNTTMICASETTISIPIQVCCRCAVPDNPDYPGMGRNTSGTALTGDKSELTIFPNPNQSGKLQVNAFGHPVQSIKIYAIDGKLVKNVVMKEALNQVSVDISNLQPGIYQVSVADNVNTVSNKKLVVQ